MKRKEPTRPERLEASIRPLMALGATPAQVRNIVYDSAFAFAQGSGMTFLELETMLDKVYQPVKG